MAKNKYDIKTIVLKKIINEKEALAIVEEKKTSLFKKLFKKPSSYEVYVQSLTLYYECLLKISGKYVADYFRKSTHVISVDSNVHEVVLGDGVFPIESKSTLRKAFVGNRGKNKVGLPLEEHVFIEEEGEVTFDHHGREIKSQFTLNSKTVENYPQQILESNSSTVKKPEITYDAAVEQLKIILKKPLDQDIRNLNDEFTLNTISEVYIPIFEARLVGPNKKIEILRIDAVRNKIL
ncbi:hypothetical protein YTPLAS73_12570 [Nitrosarchaeum sp.]|nr:hypothetical protein YTPLAS73_12570 [Nitrosarchaeum sp.]